ncbi:hypothetical protein OAC89_02800 [Deltaproteobacteria bacterium]|nr:hypothetical protein [Deltaproteobacteria bacterium]
MKCKNHPNRDANQFCASCNIPICDDCTEKTSSGEKYCFQCAMLHAVSGVGSSLTSQRERAKEKGLEKKKEKGPFHYFVIASSVLIVVMWGVIIFGGGEKATGQRLDFVKQERVFLFMVNSSIKRYTYYEDNEYPEKLSDLVPKYLPMSKEDIPQLNRLSYERDSKTGYRLSLADPKPGSMNIVISPDGIKYESTLGEGVS